MFNVVYKVMTKALAIRIKSTISRVIHPMQYRFVQGKSTHEAILNVITTIDWAEELEEEYIMINMHLEIAYDRVGWEYLLAVVEKMGFGTLYLNMVKSLFRNGNASIQMTVYTTENFRLARSIRQGCPLAPLLFAIATNPLLRNLEWQLQRQVIKPLPLPRDQVFVAHLFANDNCNIVKYEAKGISALFEVYENFSELTRSEIAHHKTEYIRLSYFEDSGVASQFELKCVDAGKIIRYLGCPIGLGLTSHQCFS